MAAQTNHPTPNPYQPQYQQHPRHTPDFNPQIGRAAPSTVPLAHHERAFEQRAISAETEVVLGRDHCWRCGGTAHIDRPFMQCEDPRCGKTFTDEQIAQYQSHHWRKALPCGHRMPGGEMTYLNTPCPTCAGSFTGAGTLPRWISLEELVPVLIPLIERFLAEWSAKLAAQVVPPAPPAPRGTHPPQSF